MNGPLSKVFHKKPFTASEIETVLSQKLPPALRKFVRGRVFLASLITRKRTAYTNVDTDEPSLDSLGLYKYVSKTRKYKKSWYWLLAATFFIGLFFSPVFLLPGILLSVGVWLAEKNTSKIKILFTFDPEVEKRFSKFCDQFPSINKSNAIWLNIGDYSGESDRNAAKFGFGLPFGMSGNLNFPCLQTNSFSVFFSPDAVIMQVGNDCSVHSNVVLSYQIDDITIQESESSPSDAITIGHRYKYPTMSGAPDKRYKNNPRYCLNKYPILKIKGGGFCVNILTSSPKGLLGIDPAQLFQSRNSLTPLSKTDAHKALLDAMTSVGATVPAETFNTKTSNAKESIDPHEVKKFEPTPVPAEQELPLSQAHTSSNFLPKVTPLSMAEAHKLLRDAVASSVVEETFVNRPNNVGNQDALVRVELDPVSSLGTTQSDISRKSAEYVIPKNETKKTNNYWIPKNQTIRVKGISISGGMTYYNGTHSQVYHPSMIEENQIIGMGSGDFRRDLSGYYPAYRNINPDDRRAYLNWLASDRSDPSTGIGFVFIYFYGLERRLVIDSKFDTSVEAEKPFILQEIRRLLAVYSTNRSFKRYANSLIDFIEVSTDYSPDFHESIMAETLKVENGAVNSKVSKHSIAIAIAQLVDQQKTITAEWAYLWAQQFSSMLDKTVVSYKPLFYKAFQQVFESRYPNGFYAIPSKVLLTVNYQAAASGVGLIEKPIGKLTDVVNAEANAAKIRELLNDVSELTEPYWRIKRRAATSGFVFDPFLHLPTSLWPQKILDMVTKLLKKVDSKEMPLGDIVNIFGMVSVNRANLQKLFTRLAESGIYAEPSIIQGASTPKVGDTLLLYRHEPSAHLQAPSAGFHGATVFAELACAVSAVDGHVSTDEIEHIHHRITHWPGLTSFEQKCIASKVTMFLKQTVTFAKLKAKLKLIPPEEIDSVARMLAGVSGADNNLNPLEISLLEKIFAALEIPDKLYSYLHSSPTAATNHLEAQSGLPSVDNMVVTANSQISSSGSEAELITPKAAGINLDFKKIAALQAETKHVSSILSAVFDQESDNAQPPEVISAVEPTASGTVSFEVFPSLNSKQAIFLNRFLTNPAWAKDELNTIASDLGLMVDGTLDVINELAWDVFDDPLFEGDHYLEVNPDLAEQIIASASAQ